MTVEGHKHQTQNSSEEQPPETQLVVDETSTSQDLVEEVRRLSHQLYEEVGKVVVGQRDVIEQVCMAMFCRGHALLVGVPGLAKTLLVSTIARSLNLAFNRIQFTPDLMPSDITGTEVIEEERATGKRHLRFVKGPVFANVILADEINRTPPKTQAALLEAMQEHHVTIGGTQHNLPEPFFVLATQNPIEQEGTYPLPEAQLDRFQFMVRVGYPTEEEELEVVKRTTAQERSETEQVLDAEHVLRIQQLVRAVPVADHVVRAALRIVRATRRPEGDQEDHRPPFIQKYLSWGAGPRASQYLVLAAKARAVLASRTHATQDDIRSVAHPVLRHRLITNFGAEADGVRADDLIDQLLDHVQTEDEGAATTSQMDAVMR